MSLETIKKKILYKSQNRGIKEMDFLLGGFARDNVQVMTASQLNNFELFLEESDIDIFNWLTNKVNVPNEYNNEIFITLSSTLKKNKS